MAGRALWQDTLDTCEPSINEIQAMLSRSVRTCVFSINMLPTLVSVTSNRVQYNDVAEMKSLFSIKERYTIGLRKYWNSRASNIMPFVDDRPAFSQLQSSPSLFVSMIFHDAISASWKSTEAKRVLHPWTAASGSKWYFIVKSCLAFPIAFQDHD